jgi:sodium-coupled monocarboxylate transporter 8/12
MYGILILIFIKGTWNIGGFDVIIERNLASGRIESPE